MVHPRQCRAATAGALSRFQRKLLSQLNSGTRRCAFGSPTSSCTCVARVRSPSRCARIIISDNHRNIKFQFPLWGRTTMALSSTKSRTSIKLRNSSSPMNGSRIRVESRFKGLRSASHPAVQFPKHATKANNWYLRISSSHCARIHSLAIAEEHVHIADRPSIA